MPVSEERMGFEWLKGERWRARFIPQTAVELTISRFSDPLPLHPQPFSRREMGWGEGECPRHKGCILVSDVKLRF
jgi:hypothetical protein